jgi:O-antigen/teichoic acid export membrane protein
MTEAAPSEKTLRQRILSSVGLSSLQFASQIGLRLISTVVLTRLLAPEIYGVFAVVLLYRYLLEMFSDLGIRSVILTKEGEVDATFLRTCWTVSMLRGGMILLISCLIALVVSGLQAAGIFAADNAYAAPVLPYAIAVLGGVSLIAGLQSMNRYAYEREMNFVQVTIGMILSNFVGLIVTILLALWLRSVWALVIGAYVQSVTLLVYSFLAFKGPRMGLSLDRPSLTTIIARGKWIIGHSALTALAQAADRLVLGFIMTSSAFGFYFIARQIVDLGSGFLNTVHAQMGLQVFTRIMGKGPEDFRRKYYGYRLFFDALAGLGTGGVFVLAPKLVELVFDDRYGQVGPFVQILVFSLLPIGALVLREAYSAERKFREMTFLSLASTVTLWVGLMVTVWMGSIPGALLVIALHRLPEVIILWTLGFRRGWLVFWREGLVLAFFALGAGLGWGLLALWKVFA